MKYPARLLASVAAIVMTNVGATATIALMAPSANALIPTVTTRTSPSEREFEACAGILRDLEIDLATIADACGAAQEPKALAKCIDGISTNTVITSDDALAGCVRVRRPSDMAQCVVVLDEELNATLTSEVLGYCSRSLLPASFENCVEGLYDPESTDAVMVMDACVEVDYDAPVVFLPTFNPITSEL